MCFYCCEYYFYFRSDFVFGYFYLRKRNYYFPLSKSRSCFYFCCYLTKFRYKNRRLLLRYSFFLFYGWHFWYFNRSKWIQIGFQYCCIRNKKGSFGQYLKGFFNIFQFGLIYFYKSISLTLLLFQFSCKYFKNHQVILIVIIKNSLHLVCLFGFCLKISESFILSLV